MLRRVAARCQAGRRCEDVTPSSISMAARSGTDTSVGTFVEIQKGVRIGARCKIQSHTFICEGVTIEDEVFVGHNVNFINDLLSPGHQPGRHPADRRRLEGDAHPGPPRRLDRNRRGPAGRDYGGRGRIVGAGAVVTRMYRPADRGGKSRPTLPGAYGELRGPVLTALAVLAAGCADNFSPGLASLEVRPGPAIHFPVIGDTIQLQVWGTDREGRSVVPAGVQFATRDPAVARVSSDGRVWSVADGSTYLIVRADALAESLQVSVAQAKDSLVLSLQSDSPIISLPGDAPLPLSCRAFDAGGNLLALSNTLTTARGAVSGSTCETAIALASGHDTLTVQAGPYQSVIPVIVAILPAVLSDPAIPLAVDSLPTGTTPWSPSLVRHPGGGVDLYFTAYHDAADQPGGKAGDLHRLFSSDGIHFEYDGLVLRRDPVPCSPRGTGIENVAVVPRSEGGGWRMYFAAGSDACYGWQVFSARSTDQDQWTLEAGVRISNGRAITPLNRSLPPWPAGEGMHLELLESGEWKMLVGSYERIEPRENRFQIIDWRSSDQLNWAYTGPVLTTRQVGPLARRSVYSPTVQDIAPGLKRMFFTGDNLDAPGGRSRIFSAVSAEGTGWQVEGIVLGHAGVDYYYSTLVDSLLVFVRDVPGHRALGGVRIDTR